MPEFDQALAPGHRRNMFGGRLSETTQHQDMNFARIAETLIEEAMREGAFDNLAGLGKPLPPLPPGDPFDVMMARILERNGAVPIEVELKRTIADKARDIQNETDPDKAEAGLKELRDLQLKLAMAVDGRSGRR
ncbi:MAG: DnaJ family domain-containing protein [Rhizobiaceae bacterium]